MEVGVEQVVRAQHGALDCLWFLDLGDHLGGLKHLGCGGEDFGARVRMVDRRRNPVTGSGFDHHLTVADEFAHAVGQADPIFTVLDFLWNADAHTPPHLTGRLIFSTVSAINRKAVLKNPVNDENTGFQPKFMSRLHLFSTGFRVSLRRRSDPRFAGPPYLDSPGKGCLSPGS